MPPLPAGVARRLSLPSVTPRTTQTAHTHQNQVRLEQLFRLVQGCHACPRMEGRRRVLSAKNGRAGVDVLFVAEAPGRNGADRTGIPIHGDPSGNTFERLLTSVGWNREDVFVTNAVLCNPRDPEGNNATPSDEELANCSFHLRSTLEVVGAQVVVTLGTKPLAALSLIRPHKIIMRESMGTANEWNGRWVFPLYHPSPRAVLHRSFNQQTADWKKLKEFVDSAPWRFV